MSEDEVLMRMLPDHLVPNLDIVIVSDYSIVVLDHHFHTSAHVSVHIVIPVTNNRQQRHYVFGCPSVCCTAIH